MILDGDLVDIQSQVAATLGEADIEGMEAAGDFARGVVQGVGEF